MSIERIYRLVAALGARVEDLARSYGKRDAEGERDRAVRASETMEALRASVNARGATLSDLADAHVRAMRAHERRFDEGRRDHGDVEHHHAGPGR